MAPELLCIGLKDSLYSMTGQQTSLSILYADICDSVSLYEREGDAKAHQLVERSLQVMIDITRRHGGTVIRTQGDGVMSTFPSADAACAAAREMQEGHGAGPVSIRVGFNHGVVIKGGGDVYGDAVNLAARVTGLARGGEILTTQETVAELQPEQRLTTRLLDRTKVKGKTDPVNIYSFVNETDAQATVVAGSRTGMGRLQRAVLRLEYQGRKLDLDSGSQTLFIGRSERCQLLVESDFASRVHATIEAKRDHFVLTDQSTNGTYVQTREGRQVYLKRESARLIGDGVISLGTRPDGDEASLVRYSNLGD